MQHMWSYDRAYLAIEALLPKIWETQYFSKDFTVFKKWIYYTDTKKYDPESSSEAAVLKKF